MNRLLVAISVVLLLAFAACKKAPGPANGKSIQPNNNIDSTVAMSAQVNAAAWQTDSAFAYTVVNSGNDSGVVNLMITATEYASNGTPSTITFNISNYTGAQTYTIDPPGNMAFYYLGNTRHIASSGQITIAVNTIIAHADTGYSLTGTFYFTADSLRITNGVFNVAKP